MPDHDATPPAALPKPILAARLLLLADAMLYLLIGIAVALRPEFMQSFGIALLTGTGTTTTRTWGALFAGIGIAGFALAARRDWLTPGLLIFVLVSGAIFFARLYGIWVDGPEPRQWTELRREAIGFCLALAGFGMLRWGDAIGRRSTAA